MKSEATAINIVMEKTFFLVSMENWTFDIDIIVLKGKNYLMQNDRHTKVGSGKHRMVYE